MRLDIISVVIPAYEEAANLRFLCKQLTAALARIENIAYEVLLVDDGSKDASWEIIEDLHARDHRIKGIRLSRNFGHQAAVTAGLQHAEGDAVITMDSDLQHPPDQLPAMIDKWRQGFDVVSMVRDAAEHEGWFKSTTSRLFYKLINSMSDVKIQPGVADFRLLDRRVVKELNALKERGRFVRGLISWIGFREAQIHYTPRERHAGSTKYSLRKMVMLGADAISSFSTAPLRLSIVLGVAVNLLCVGLMGYAIYNKLNENKDLTEWASTFLTMLFLHGVQLLMIGVLGVYIGRIFDEVKQRPHFIAEEVLGKNPRQREEAIAVISAISGRA
jgi:dolichol-phosphate mannosyltransferase